MDVLVSFLSRKTQETDFQVGNLFLVDLYRIKRFYTGGFLTSHSIVNVSLLKSKY